VQVEEKELDASKVQKAMNDISSSHEAEAAAQRQRSVFMQFG
jgi:hypothetical protein